MRVAKAFAAFLAGLGWTWACAYVLSRLPSGRLPAGCADIEHCGSSTAALAGMAAFYLAPAVAFAFVASVGTRRRWPAKRWGVIWCALLAATAAAMALAYR